MSPRRIRVGGALLVLCALVLLAIGAFMASFIFDLPVARPLLPAGIRIEGSNRPDGFSAKLSDPAGLATLWVFLFGLVTLVLGLDMLAFARRRRGLFSLFLGLAAVFVVAGLIVTLISGGTVPRLHL